MLINQSVVELDRAAVRYSVELVREVDAAALTLPTPCAGWDLRRLLAHMSVQHRGFAAAAAGHGADRELWVYGEPATDPVAEYTAAAAEVLAAFAVPDVLDREFALPEIQGGATFPAEQAISFHFIDYVVHGWDVARSLGLPYEPEPAVAQAGLRIAKAVPTGAARDVAGAAFAPVLPAPEGSGTVDQIVAILGRSPAWPKP